MSSVLVCTIGNSDIQITPSNYAILNESDSSLFRNRGNVENFVLTNVRENSKELLNRFDYFKDLLSLPILQLTINTFDGKDIVLVGTDQSEYFSESECHQDTLHVCEFIKNLLIREGYNVETELLKKPNEIAYCSKFFNKLFGSLNYNLISVSSSSGIPNTKIGIYFSALFFENISIGEVNVLSGEIDRESFLDSRKEVVYQKVESLLEGYDFKSILNLPVSKKIKGICNKAIDYYNFDRAVVNAKGVNFEEKSREGIFLLVDTLEVLFVQGKITELFGRINRIEEAIWQYVFYDFLVLRGLISGNDKVHKRAEKNSDEKFEKFIKQSFNTKSLLLHQFNDIFCSEEDVKFVDYGKNFYPAFFEYFEFEKAKSVYEFFKKLNLNIDTNYSEGEKYYSSSSKLSLVRNKSILGHGLEGVGEDEILSCIEQNSLMSFIVDLRKLLEELFELEEEHNSLFNLFVGEIRDELRK